MNGYVIDAKNIDAISALIKFEDPKELERALMSGNLPFSIQKSFLSKIKSNAGSFLEEKMKKSFPDAYNAVKDNVELSTHDEYYDDQMDMAKDKIKDINSEYNRDGDNIYVINDETILLGLKIKQLQSEKDNPNNVPMFALPKLTLKQWKKNNSERLAVFDKKVEDSINAILDKLDKNGLIKLTKMLAQRVNSIDDSAIPPIFDSSNIDSVSEIDSIDNDALNDDDFIAEVGPVRR